MLNVGDPSPARHAAEATTTIVAGLAIHAPRELIMLNRENEGGRSPDEGPASTQLRAQEPSSTELGATENSVRWGGHEAATALAPQQGVGSLMMTRLVQPDRHLSR